MPRKRRRSGVVSFVFLATLAVVGGVIFAVWRGAGPLPDPEGCKANVSGRTVNLDPEQGRNAALISAIAVRRGLPARAASIALATAFQESKIRNLAHGDRDSVGIFQQRPSQGWGTAAQIQDEHYAINKFYDALVKIDGYETMRITEAAQKVQRSGFPEAYEDHAPDARALASALTGYSPGGDFTCVVHEPKTHGTAAAVTRSLAGSFGSGLEVRRTGARQDLTLPVATGQDGNRQGWAAAAYLVAYAGNLKIESIAFDGLIWHSGRASEKGWQDSNADGSAVRVILR
ncbi:hypothetical protein [Nocardioides marmorisolisilvae]|uniref:Heavy metal transporter n=1 Tax=Nocardioides marmorisolisilvae TaxID=1542737 RepID=A0A3N0DXC9_9ACTN|nr:hypothetical protein EFL95_15380 [Nocardioides marmorisolisilvae]